MPTTMSIYGHHNFIYSQDQQGLIIDGDLLRQPTTAEGEETVVDPTVNMEPSQENSSPVASGIIDDMDPPNYFPLAPDTHVQINCIDQYVGTGVRTGMSAVFIAGELAGIGMLTTPWAMVNLGWVGFALLLLFGIATAYSTSCLGDSWVILEERFIEFRIYPCRDPYSKIAKLAVGKTLSNIAIACVQMTLYGAATVYLMLVAQSAQKLFSDTHPEISFCTWLFVFAIALSSLMFLESPKDYCIVAIGALSTTMIGCYFIVLQILFDDSIKEGSPHPVQYNTGLTANEFFLSFGAILFAYGGASAFPTIQNEIFKKNDWSRTMVTAFMLLAILFGCVVLGGFVVYGDRINPNILMSLGDSWFSYIALILMAAHLILGFLIIINPVSQNIEDLFNVQEAFGLQKFLVRMALLASMIFIGALLPNFSYIVALIGSLTVALVTFVFPSIFYLNICAQQGPWPDRSLSTKSKLLMYIIISVGLASGCVALATAVASINFSMIKNEISLILNYLQL